MREGRCHYLGLAHLKNSRQSSVGRIAARFENIVNANPTPNNQSLWSCCLILPTYFRANNNYTLWCTTTARVCALRGVQCTTLNYELQIWIYEPFNRCACNHHILIGGYVSDVLADVFDREKIARKRILNICISWYGRNNSQSLLIRNYPLSFDCVAQMRRPPIIIGGRKRRRHTSPVLAQTDRRCTTCPVAINIWSSGLVCPIEI